LYISPTELSDSETQNTDSVITRHGPCSGWHQ